MKRIGVIGLGQRIAHVLAAMKAVGWDFEVGGHPSTTRRAVAGAKAPRPEVSFRSGGRQGASG